MLTDPVSWCIPYLQVVGSLILCLVLQGRRLQHLLSLQRCSSSWRRGRLLVLSMPGWSAPADS